MIRKLVLFSLLATNLCLASSPADLTRVKSQIDKALQSGRSLASFYAELEASYGKKAVASLIQIAQDKKNQDQVRWAALFGIGRISGRENLALIKNTMKDSSWMLRDAAIKTAAALGAKELTSSIEERLHDDALVVRTTAVRAIEHLKLTESSGKLVDALFDPVNYHAGKPLWIQKHILGTISLFQYKKAVPKLVELLETTGDETFKKQLVGTLEKLTGKSFPTKTINEQVYLWKRNSLSEMVF